MCEYMFHIWSPRIMSGEEGIGMEERVGKTRWMWGFEGRERWGVMAET